MIVKLHFFWINSFMDSFGACFFVEFCQFEPRQFFGGIQSVEVPNWCAVFWVIRWGSALWPPPSPTVVKALQDVRISSWTWSFLMLDVSWLSTSKSNEHSIPNSCTFDFDRFLSESWTFPFDQIVIGCHWCHQQTAVAICLKCHWPQRRPLRPGMHKTLARPARRPDNPEALAQEKAGGSAIGFASPIIGDDELSLQSYSCWWYIIISYHHIINDYLNSYYNQPWLWWSLLVTSMISMWFLWQRHTYAILILHLSASHQARNFTIINLELTEGNLDLVTTTWIGGKIQNRKPVAFAMLPGCKTGHGRARKMWI